jgi:hypothetical protein
MVVADYEKIVCEAEHMDDWRLRMRLRLRNLLRLSTRYRMKLSMRGSRD